MSSGRSGKSVCVGGKATRKSTASSQVLTRSSASTGKSTTPIQILDDDVVDAPRRRNHRGKEDEDDDDHDDDDDDDDDNQANAPPRALQPRQHRRKETQPKEDSVIVNSGTPVVLFNNNLVVTTSASNQAITKFSSGVNILKSRIELFLAHKSMENLLDLFAEVRAKSSDFTALSENNRFFVMTTHSVAAPARSSSTSISKFNPKLVLEMAENEKGTLELKFPATPNYGYWWFVYIKKIS